MNKELFKEGIKKCYILPLVLTILLIIVVPIYIWGQKSQIESASESLGEIEINVTQETEDLSIKDAYKILTVDTLVYNPYTMLVILILPVVLGVQLFGYSKKNKNRLSDFIEEKGFTKDCVYKTNIVTGILLSILPIIATSIVLVLVKLFGGLNDILISKTILNWTCLGIFSSILFFVITALISFISQNRFKQVLYTYGLLFIPVFIIYLFEIFMTRVIYGFPGFATWFIELLNEIPSIKVCQVFISSYINYAFSIGINLWYVLVYIIMTIAFCFLGYKLLKFQNQEKLKTVGDIIFKYMWLSILVMLMYITIMVNINNAILSIIITLAIILIIYILKECIKNRSFKAILNGKKYYIISVIIILFVLIFSSNLFGYENKLPNIDDVEYMTYTVAYPNENEEIIFKDKTNIESLINKHKEFILNKNKNNNINISDDVDTVYLQYKLKNGETIIRSYETVLSIEEEFFKSEEYVKQKYSYMYDKSDDIDYLKIAGIYNGETFILDVNKNENQELQDELISYIGSDLLDNNVHLPKEGEYQQYSEKEGIQLLQIAILDGLNQYTNYLYYLSVDDSYKLVTKIQELIDEESEFITWNSEDNE